MTRFVIALAFAALSLAGCRAPAEPGEVLEAARARWAGSGIRDYSITVRRTCECTPAMTGPVVVEVRAGAVATRHYVDSGEAVDASLAPLFPSVDELFEILDDAARTRAAVVVARYDSERGYPTYVAIDRDRTRADEIIYTVTDFLER